MKNLFGNLSNKVNEMLQDDTSLLSQAKKKLEDKYVQIPINAEMLLYIFKKQEIENISNLDVGITDDSIIISGLAKKMLMSVHFSVEIQPESASERTLSFKVVGMKPVNYEWVKKSVFNKPPILAYVNEQLSIDLNVIDNIRKIPVGSIKNFMVKDEKLFIGIGI